MVAVQPAWILDNSVQRIHGRDYNVPNLIQTCDPSPESDWEHTMMIAAPTVRRI